MAKFNAPKLLRMAIANQHMSYCPNTGSPMPVTECKCWKHEVACWSVASFKKAFKVRKVKPLKCHYSLAKCGSKNRISNTTDIADVTCGHCKKRIASGKVQLQAQPVTMQTQGFIKFGDATSN